MISYKPLREYLSSNGLSPNKLYEEGVISTNIATSINNDRPMSFENIEKICTYLGIPIERAIVIIPNSEKD